MKKLFAILLALVFVFSVATFTFAAETSTITILNDDKGHTYEAYQVFAGDVEKTADGNKLKNITWGAGITDAGKTALLSFNGGTYEDVYALSDALNDGNAELFAAAVGNYLATPQGSTSTLTGGKYVISNLPTGYYLIKDKDGSLAGSADAYTQFILQVGDVEIEPKSDVPTVEKKVKDINDSTETELTAWQDSADYDIGDEIPFAITGTLPKNYSAYKTYYYAFHDTFSKGLDYQNNAVIYAVNGATRTTITDAFTITYNNGQLDMVCNNLMAINTRITASTKIVVEYTAILNEDAVIGYVGNPNTVYLQFSNNPNAVGGGDDMPEPPGETPKDTVIVFTYQLVVNKVDQDANPLAGAGFTLFKFDKKADKYVAVSDEISGEDLTTFTFRGLDDGMYKLCETTTPSGYNDIDDVLFEVTADHEILSADPQLKELKVNNETIIVEKTDTEKYTGVLNTTVINRQGKLLPTTGAMGTTVFYIIGGVLVLLAMVLLVAKKRMSREND